MTRIMLQRSAELPDALRVARSLSAPHLGPRLLFFSGGSALNKISRALKSYTYNSAHLITPFDSGGSSQVLREAFDMPAVGDLRSRLMALADESDLGQPDIYALFSHRLPKDGEPTALRTEVEELVAGKHPLIRAVSTPMGQLICDFLREFLVAAPMDFDFRGASIGNLILAGGYLAHGRLLEPVLFLMSKMVDVRGTVRGVVDCNLQLGVELTDGRRIHGQRQISGKEAPPIDTPIARLFLSEHGKEIDPGSVPLPKRNRKLIRRADLICYPPGSLFSSVVANLLPAGVGRTIARCEVPKVYLPSLGTDPEALGLTLADRVAAILAPLRADAGMEVPATRLMTHVLCDSSEDPAACAEVTERHGIPCHRLPLVSDEPERYDRRLACAALVSLV
ncbi:GAK system CofD-like protein [Alloyangia pacifica]|uniref:CofD-related protein, GAK system n=1 Tax=Alloyangia pacifica TaxID=311180 RepID=A0A1I6W934_9RHOB|nr:GAK system CofD-like protein [Alloyangia pacifica]SDI46009.1 CofD-related protein, GAK system [Alloyangia pacifica]SFT22503.1 CofD-related protein, GAK system [Alloyangia pacifica]